MWPKSPISIEAPVPGGRRWRAERNNDLRRPTAVGPIASRHDVVLAARSLFLESQAGIVVRHLRDWGVPSILLKGPAIATWLYDEEEFRPFGDIDLLVSPGQFDEAIEVLAQAGYVHRLIGAASAELGPKERELVGPLNDCIDLHSGLIGMLGPAEYCWDRLMSHTVTFGLRSGVEVRVLDVPARTMHLALHAAQNGPIDGKAVADLRRGLNRVGREVWAEAAELAAELEAVDAFAAGLRLLSEGRLLADELSLPRRMTVELVLRTRSATQQAIFFERLGEAQGIQAKVSLVARKIVPTPALLRANSARARRSRLGLVCGWAYRPLSLIAHFPSALIAWYRARRVVARQSPPVTRRHRA